MTSKARDKPDCLGYVRTGRTCVPNDRSHLLTSSSKSSSIASYYCIPFRVPGSQKDRQLLHFFYVQGAADASQYNAVVRLALMAPSSPHMDLAQIGGASSDLHHHHHTSDYSGIERGAAADGVATSTLTRYGTGRRFVRYKALSLVREWKTKAKRSKAAMRHLDSGLRVFSSRKSNRRIANRGDDFMLAKMADVLARLNLQASFLSSGRIPLLALVSAEERAMAMRGGEEEHAFSGLDDAHLDWIRLQNWMFRYLLSENVEISAAVLEEKEKLL
ncbi:hypothetical protein B0H63DRAFT_447424 [Podospora didyma]|uniref:Uncharacterized protein n=1 Tax=Podospora didyma TaxID=330526 RepID=A0AAE0NRR8_9PEZI|nr:hypothetical protein B0H63DRAFT_447424 [Podospora didyma]